MNKFMSLYIVTGICIMVLAFSGTIIAQDNECDVIVQEGELIQDAVNSASPGDIICVEEGVYDEDIEITTPAISLVSTDNEATPVLSGNSSGVSITDADNVLVQGFIIREYDDDGILVENSSGVVVRENSISENGNGISSTDSPHLLIEENEIYDQELGFRSGYGIDLAGSDSVRIKNNLLTGNRAEGIQIVESNQVLVENNEISDNVRSGVLLENSDGVVITGNTITGHTQNGIFAEESRNCVVEENVIADNVSDGVVFEDYSHWPSVLDNTFSGHAVDILINQSAFAEIKNNTMEKGVVIEPNNIRFDFDAGRTYYDLEVDNNTVNGGTLYYAKNTDDPTIPADAQQVIIYNSTNVTVSDMDFSDVSVGLQLAYSNAAEISNISADNHTRDGVRLVVSRYAAVTNNSFNENEAHGLYLESSDTSNVTNNSATNNGEKGMVAFWSTGNVFSDNTASGNGGIGIHQWHSPDGRVQNNIAEENKIGIHAERSNRTVMHNNIANENEEYGLRLILIRNPEVTDNEARHNGWGGMRFGNAEWTGFITGNEFTGNGRDGLWLETLSTSNNDITIADNVFSDNGRHGVYLPRSDDTSVLENTIERNQENGIHLANSHMVYMIENSINDNGGYGIYMNNRVNQFARVEGNVLSGHTIDLHIDEVSQSNRIQDNSFQTGILITGDELDHFSHNISDNTVGDKELFYTRNDDEVSVPDDPGQIIVVNSDYLEITDHHIEGVAAAIQVAYTDTVLIHNSTINQNVVGAHLFNNELYTIDNNLFQNNGTGLMLQGEFVPDTLVNNEFVINDVGLDADNLDDVADARHNWWGDESGPGGGIEDPETGTIADGDGDVIEGSVRFDPWLGEGTELDAPFFAVQIDSTNSPVQEMEELIVDVTVTNEGDGTASQEIILQNFDGDVVDSKNVVLDDTHNTETVTLVWSTDDGDAGEGEIAVLSDDDSDKKSVLIDDVTSVPQDDRPVAYEMSQNYPNPFNPSTTIRFALPESARVQLIVYDMLGRKVESLVDGYTEAGYHDVVFDAGHLSSGVYIYQIRAGDFVETKRLMLIK